MGELINLFWKKEAQLGKVIDFVGPAQDVPKILLDYDVVSVKGFPASGTFKAVEQAENWLVENGYGLGPMQRDAPRGIAKDVDYIAKWRNISPDEYSRLDGVMLPAPEFREGGATILFFR